MRPIQLFLLLIMLSFSQGGIAQIQLLDSLKGELGKKHSDEEKITLLLAIADQMEEFDLSTALKYSYEALELAENLTDESLQSECYLNLGKFHFATGNIDESLVFYRKALAGESIHRDQKKLGDLYNSIGFNYSRTGNLDSALFYQLASYHIAVEIKDSLQQISSLRSLGGTYYKKGDFDLALSHFRQGMSLLEHFPQAVKEKSHLLNNLGILYSDWGEYYLSLQYYKEALSIMDSLEMPSSIGRIYNNMGNIYWYLESYDSALYFYNESLIKREQLGDQNGKAYILNNLGMIYGSQGDFEKSLEYFGQSLNLFESMNNRGGIVMVTYNFAYVYMEIKDYDNAIKYLNQGLIIAQQQGFKDYITANLEALQDVYQEVGNWESAYFTLERYKRTNDSIREMKNMELIRELEVKFENEKHKAELSTLENLVQTGKVKGTQNTILLAGVFIIIFLIILSSYLLILRIKIRSKNEYNKLTPALLRYQMNPEFINSSLSGIKELISKNRLKESGLFLSGFAKLMRSFIETSIANVIILDKEIDIIQRFVQLHQMRYDHEIGFDINIHEDVETEILAIPPLLFFPALVHMIDYHINKGKIDIMIKLITSNNKLVFDLNFEYVVDIKENKIDKGDLDKSLKTIKERIKSINKSYKEEIEFFEEVYKKDSIGHMHIVVKYPIKPA